MSSRLLPFLLVLLVWAGVPAARAAVELRLGEVRLLPAMPAPGSRPQLEVTVRNTGDERSPGFRVEVRQDGARVARLRFRRGNRVPPGEERRRTTRLPRVAALPVCYEVRIEPDPARYRVVEGVRRLCAGDAAGDGGSEGGGAGTAGLDLRGTVSPLELWQALDAQRRAEARRSALALQEARFARDRIARGRSNRLTVVVANTGRGRSPEAMLVVVQENRAWSGSRPRPVAQARVAPLEPGRAHRISLWIPSPDIAGVYCHRLRLQPSRPVAEVRDSDRTALVPCFVATP